MCYSTCFGCLYFNYAILYDHNQPISHGTPEILHKTERNRKRGVIVFGLRQKSSDFIGHT
jgi:hypothetical protein